MTVKLTKSFVASLKPDPKGKVWFDSILPGFGVKALPRKPFIYQYRPRQTRIMRRITIGEFRDPPKCPEGTDTVDGARRIAAGHRAAAMAGRDPFAEAKTAKNADTVKGAAKQEDDDPKTVTDLATLYLEKGMKKGKKKKKVIDPEAWRAPRKRVLDTDILPAIGAKLITELKRRDVVKILNAIVERGSPISANRTQSLLHRMFNFAIGEGLLDFNPCAKIERETEEPRDRYLSAEEIPLFWRGLDRATMELGLRELLKFLLLSGRRKSEALFINEREINRSDREWRLPASRNKVGKDMAFPLTATQLAILDNLGASDDGYYFVSGRTGKPFDPRSVDHATRDLFIPRERSKKHGKPAPVPPLAAMPSIVPHDLRRSCATGMKSIGISHTDVQHVLGHIPPDMLGKIYDWSTALPEKWRALEIWDRYVAGLLNPPASNVVTFAVEAAQ